MATGYKLAIAAKEVSYDKDKNTSNVSITVSATSPVDLQYGGWNLETTTCKVTCNGVTKNINVPSYDFRKARTITLGSLAFNDIKHSDDGKKNIAISASWNTDNSYVLGSNGSQTLIASASLKLTDIPRQATITQADDFTDEDNPTLEYVNNAGDSVDSLQACISLTGATADIVYRDIPKNKGTYTFNLTQAEKDLLIKNTVNSKSRKVIFFVKTVIDKVIYASKLEKTFTVVNANPTVGEFSYVDTNQGTINVTKDSTLIVQNKSILRLDYSSPTMKKSAEFVKYKFTLNGVTKEVNYLSGSIDFGTVNSASDLVLKAEVTDSRGYTGTKEITVKMVEYTNPTGKISLSRLNNYEDETYLLVDGNIASINDKNRMSIKYRMKKKGGTYNDFTVIEDNVKNTITCDKNYQYIFNVVVTDLFGATFNVEVELNKGIFPLFIDTLLNSVGINGFPTKKGSFEVFGEAYANNLPIAGMVQGSFDNLLSKSGLLSIADEKQIWYNLINIRHRNGATDGNQFGLQIRNPMISLNSKLQVRQQTSGNWGAWRTIQEEPITLFSSESGQTTNVTLSENSANFSYIEIFYSDNNNKQYNSVKVKNPNGKNVVLQLIEPSMKNNPFKVYIRTSLWFFEGTALKHDTSAFISHTSGMATEITNNQYIKIHDVIGYR